MLKELATGLGVTFENMFKKPYTVQYPDEKLEMFPRFRGRSAMPVAATNGSRRRAAQAALVPRGVIVLFGQLPFS